MGCDRFVGTFCVHGMACIEYPSGVDAAEAERTTEAEEERERGGGGEIIRDKTHGVRNDAKTRVLARKKIVSDRRAVCCP